MLNVRNPYIHGFEDMECKWIKKHRRGEKIDLSIKPFIYSMKGSMTYTRLRNTLRISISWKQILTSQCERIEGVIVWLSERKKCR